MARILMIANSSWNLQHFRQPVLRALLAAGHRITTVSPDADGIAIDREKPPHRTWVLHRSKMNPLAELAAISQLSKIVAEEKPDVIFSFTIKPNIYGGIAARWRGVPAIPNVSGLGSSFMGRAIVRNAVQRLYKFAFARAPVVFFQNGEDEGLFVSSGTVLTGQTRVLPGSGINVQDFFPTPLPATPRFLMIARLLRDKGVREYVEAARLVKARVPDSSFALVGGLDPGNPTGVSQEELNGWIASGAIDYMGPASDVRPFISDASVVVLPSYREGLPRSLLEGAAMGRPLVACDVPGCRSVVREGVTGFLCAARDGPALAVAMERLALLPERERARIGSNARRMAEEEYDERLVAQAYLNVVKEVCESPQAPTGGIQLS